MGFYWVSFLLEMVKRFVKFPKCGKWNVECRRLDTKNHSSIHLVSQEEFLDKKCFAWNTFMSNKLNYRHDLSNVLSCPWTFHIFLQLCSIQKYWEIKSNPCRILVIKIKGLRAKVNKYKEVIRRMYLKFAQHNIQIF